MSERENLAAERIRRAKRHSRIPDAASLTWTGAASLAHNFLQSSRLIADGCDSFRKNCAVGIAPNRLALGLLTGDDFDKWVRPEDMIGPKAAKK